MLEKIRGIFSSQTIALRYEKYKKYISPLALLAGFILDSLTLRRADLLAENLLIVVYLLIVSTGICLLNIWQVPDSIKENKVHLTTHLFVQFAFGGLFSTFLVFYTRSGAFSTSFLFILFIALNLIGSEIWKKKYLVCSFQISILFLAIYSYTIFLVPIIFNQIGAAMFFLSGAISLGIIYLYLLIFFFYTKEKFVHKKKLIARNVGIIFVVMNFFYFTNIIPPVPLSLNDKGVYHSLTPVSGGYLALNEVKVWRDYFRLSKVFHKRPGDVVYVYSAVFSPTDLNISLVHDWQYFDDSKNRWVTQNKVSAPIIGGREAGYRFYSINKRIFPALWRVDVETARGQVIGRIKFRVVNAVKPLDLVEVVK